MSEILELTDETFEKEVFKQDIPVLADFWATWCGPCRKLVPVLAELANEYDGKIKFVKIKADENTATAQKYSVIGVPCLILFKNDKAEERMVNILKKSDIKKILDKHVGAK